MLEVFATKHRAAPPDPPSTQSSHRNGRPSLWAVVRGARSGMHCPWYRMHGTLAFSALWLTTGRILKFAQLFPVLWPYLGCFIWHSALPRVH